jgi:hypothetical protein
MSKPPLNWVPDTNEANGYPCNGLTASAGRVVYQVFAIYMTDRRIARYRIRGRRWPRWTVLGTTSSISEATDLCEAHHHQRSVAASS